jgi:hypothetical protein
MEWSKCVLAFSDILPNTVSMYVATVPNRNSPPAILLRESYRENGKVKTRTLANITHLGARKIEALRRALSGPLPTAGAPLPESFVIARSLPHGHVAAVLGCLRNLELDSILDPLPSCVCQLDLAPFDTLIWPHLCRSFACLRRRLVVGTNLPQLLSFHRFWRSRPELRPARP